MAHAVFKTGGKQYRVAEGDRIEIEKVDGEVGDIIEFGEVLMTGAGDIGAPFVDGAKVTAEVLDQFRARKVVAFKFKRRKGHHKTTGHRQQKTRLMIKSIA